MKNENTALWIVAVAAVSSVAYVAITSNKKKSGQADAYPEETPGGSTALPPAQKFKRGQEVYAGDRAGVDIYKAEKKSGTWTPTGDRYGLFKYAESVGTVVFSGIVPQGMEHAGDRYYIVSKCLIDPDIYFGIPTPGVGCSYGVVLEKQII